MSACVDAPWSRCLADDQDAHEENHDEENPHEEPVHHLGDLLPLGPFGAGGPLLSEAVGDVLHVAHQLGVHSWDPAAVAAEHAGAEADSGGPVGRLFVLRAAGILLIFRAAQLLLVYLAAVAVEDPPIGAFVLPQGVSRGVAALVPGDVVLDSGLVLRPRGLRTRVFVTLPVLLTRRFAIRLDLLGKLLTVVFILGDPRCWRRGGGGAVFSHLVHKEDLGHVVDDEDFGPAGNWFGLGSTEVDVHDENGERGGGSDHGHGGNVILSCAKDRGEKFRLKTKYC